MKENQNYSVIYSDEHIVIFNKRSGFLTAADRNDKDSPRLDEAAKEEFGTLYALHRIEKDASGIVLYARTPEAHKALLKQFDDKSIKLTYHCLINGHPLWQTLHVDTKLLADGDPRHRTVVDKKYGKPAKTDFSLIGNCGPFSWIEAKPKFLRKDQVLIHLHINGFDAVCDTIYSGNQKPVKLSDFKRKYNGDTLEERPLLSRTGLHAWSISFTHPVTSQEMTFTAPYQKDMDALRKQLAKIFKVDPLASEENI